MEKLKNIYLIDDDNIFNLIHTKLIQKSNFADNILIFDNAGDALSAFRHSAQSQTLPELIFLDINMPVMDGWDFLEELKLYTDHVFEKSRVVILSSSIDRKDIVRSKTYKMVIDFISKPLTAGKIEIIRLKLLDSQFMV